MTAKFNRMILRTELTIDEGMRYKVYRCTAGKLSIGVGRNLDDVGLLPGEEEKLGLSVADIVKNGVTSNQALVMLDNDITRVEKDLDRHLPWWRTLDPVRQRVMVNMAFNMGIGNLKRGLRSFVNTLRMVEHGQYDRAADAMLKSQWARQVGKRANRLSELMRLGEKKA